MTHSKIWIGNLHYSLNEKELASLLNLDYALISIQRDERYRSKGHGFIITENQEQFDRLLLTDISILTMKIKFAPFVEKEEITNA